MLNTYFALSRPMTGSMNSKFVSAGSSQDAAEAKSGVGEEDEEVKDAKKAAKMKMYGKLTRERVEWHPAKILCIRFVQHSLTPSVHQESLS